jgi:hypothetical protein
MSEKLVDPPSSLAMSHRVARGIGRDDALIRAQQQPGHASARRGMIERDDFRLNRRRDFVHLARSRGEVGLRSNSGEGGSPRVRICGESPSPRPSPRKRGEKCPILNSLCSGGSRTHISNNISNPPWINLLPSNGMSPLRRASAMTFSQILSRSARER